MLFVYYFSLALLKSFSFSFLFPLKKNFKAGDLSPQGQGERHRRGSAPQERES